MGASARSWTKRTRPVRTSSPSRTGCSNRWVCPSPRWTRRTTRHEAPVGVHCAPSHHATGERPPDPSHRAADPAETTLDRGDRALPGRHLPGCQEAHAMNISETTLILRTIALTMRALSTLHKLWVMERNTVHWNGLGKALRFEKRILFWLW